MPLNRLLQQLRATDNDGITLNVFKYLLKKLSLFIINILVRLAINGDMIVNIDRYSINLANNSRFYY